MNVGKTAEEWIAQGKDGTAKVTGNNDTKPNL